MISDFAVLGGQQDLYGLVASVPTAWRTLVEVATAGPRSGITAAVNADRRRVWAGLDARHGAIPGIRIADRVGEGVTCIRLTPRWSVAFRHAFHEQPPTWSENP